MSCKFFLNGLMGAALALGAVAAQAANVVTMNTQVGGAYVNTNKYTGTGGGGFRGTLTDAGVHNQDPLLAYCVEVGEFFTLGVAYTDYSVMSASMYSRLNPSKVGYLANLFTWAASDSANWFNSPDPVEKKARSSGIQLAVWEIVYDTGLDLASGAFFVNGGGGTDVATLSYATTLLTYADDAQANPFNIYILEAEGRQDQLFWEDARTGQQITRITPVPEPVSLALVAVALTGLAFTRRRG